MAGFGEAGGPKDGAPAWKNTNAWIAGLFGIIFLFICYDKFPEEKKFPHEAFHEVGFALIVAVFIWIIFEVASKNDAERAWNDRIDRITENVFFGVLGNNLSKEFINEAKIVAIEHDFERSDFHVTYRISEQKYTDSIGDEADFVVLRATGVFKIKNVSTQKKPYLVGAGIPNPFVDEMKVYCKIHSASVTDASGKKILNVDRANAALKKGMDDDSIYQVDCEIEEIQINPLEEIEVAIEYTMAKESEDTEIVQTKYPTRSIVINVIDTGTPKRLVRARAIHRTAIRTDTSGSADGCYAYRINTPLLPYQGFAIFWKKVPIRPATPPPVAVAETNG